MSWEKAVEKFETLGADYAPAGLRKSIAEAIANLESIPVSKLTKLLARLRNREQA
jgi:hypothetical protein